MNSLIVRNTLLNNANNNLEGVSDGGYSSEATPVPIPNTAVKLACADGTAWATVWKSRSSPSLTPCRIFHKENISLLIPICSYLVLVTQIPVVLTRISIISVFIPMQIPQSGRSNFFHIKIILTQ